jgi:hypothetical protein
MPILWQQLEVFVNYNFYQKKSAQLIKMIFITKNIRIIEKKNKNKENKNKYY